MADAARRLLDHIVRTRLRQLDRLQAELDASAEADDNLPASVERTAAWQREEAHELADAFAAGLRRAAQQPDTPVVLDDRVPEENRMADALVRFLVTPGLATVHSEPTTQQHYRYQISIDWAALATVASEVDVPLEHVWAR